MNTEINLLEKKENKYIVPLFFGAIFIVGFLLVLGLLFLQQSSLEKKIARGQNDITEMEITLAEHNKAFASREKIEQIEIEVNTIKDHATPHVALYHHMVSLLTKEDQLIGYTLDNETSLIIDVELSMLDEVADYVSKSLDEAFIINAELTDVTNTGSTYDASLTLNIDKAILVEEFDNND